MHESYTTIISSVTRNTGEGQNTSQLRMRTSATFWLWSTLKREKYMTLLTHARDLMSKLLGHTSTCSLRVFSTSTRAEFHIWTSRHRICCWTLNLPWKSLTSASVHPVLSSSIRRWEQRVTWPQKSKRMGCSSVNKQTSLQQESVFLSWLLASFHSGQRKTRTSTTKLSIPTQRSSGDLTVSRSSPRISKISLRKCWARTQNPDQAYPKLSNTLGTAKTSS